MLHVLEGATEAVFERGDERWTVVHHGLHMSCFTNVAKDRMRLMAPVAYERDLSPARIRRALEVNFHRDARYGLMENILYAAFLHPLSSLTPSHLLRGLRDVSQLTHAFDDAALRSGATMRFEWPRPTSSGGGIRRRTEEAVQRSLEQRRRMLGHE